MESEAGAGSTFTIRLPAVAPQEAGPAAPATAPPRRRAGRGRGSGRGGTAAGTVLVIDDDAAVRDLLQRLLAREGFRVLPAAGGEEGLRLARARAPDAITLDVLMPGMDGWAVLAALKADPALADVPVVMLTIADDKALGFSLGAVEYLTKPVDRARLLRVLRRYGPGARTLVAGVRRGRAPSWWWRTTRRRAGRCGSWRRGSPSSRPSTGARRSTCWRGRHRRAGPDRARPADAGDGRVRVRRRAAPGRPRGGTSRSSC